MSYRDILYREYTSSALTPLMDISEETYLFRARAFRKKFAGILPEDRGANILDIGCGVGFFLYFLQKIGCTNTVGVDFSPEQIKTAQRFGVQGVTLSGYKEYLADKPSQFDFMLLDNVIEHQTKDEIVDLLLAIFNSLKPGGRVYISTPNVGSPFGVPLAFVDFTHEVFFTAASLAQVLTACGFVPVRVYGEPLVGVDVRSFLRKTAFSLIKPVATVIQIMGTGGVGRTKIPHVMEPSLAALAERPARPARPSRS